MSLLLLHQSTLGPQSHLQTHPRNWNPPALGFGGGMWNAGCQRPGLVATSGFLSSAGILWSWYFPSNVGCLMAIGPMMFFQLNGQATEELKMLLMFYILIEMWFTWGTHLWKSLNCILETWASQCRNRIPGNERTPLPFISLLLNSDLDMLVLK